MRGACNVRVALPGDIQKLLALAGACAEAPRWSEGAWQGLLAGEGEIARAAFVAEMDENPSGFIVASVAAGIAEIESVAVLPTLRRQGAGRMLCIEAMRWARHQGAKAVALEVRASSRGALALYAALGFVEQGRRRGYYREPVEDAILMTASLLA